ncbi:hypothetical protein BCR42DRAFT_161778 [Absidia repens]|uniref:Actin-like ATPase domain-containing protein n=1 Tax=Absidia repens TaxID=90262 RepID=A0A1X2ITC0_9FUNG|nr:hypothetical protein BCR42DRAFT_161778 [Absidia repens]
MIEDEYAYVVGIDFGTTFSGCCYAFTKDRFEDFQDITAWPKQRNAAYPKTPTVLMYKKDSQQVGSWGDAARIQSERPHLQDLLLEKFKLYLDEESLGTLPPLPNGLTPLQVIADYLRLLHRYISETMERGFAQNYNPSNFRYCLTVPATWSDRAKAFMREASIVAGLIDRYDPPERLMLISEPEAAALYCEKTVDQFQLTHGQRFMICDAGGGTVDLIVFEINEVRRNRSLKEVTKGSGDTVGSTFLDKNMEQLIRDRFQHFGGINRRSMDQMMTVFIERIKPQFDDDDEEHFIPIPFTLGYPNEDNEEAGIMDGTVIFTAEELKEKVFEPVVLKVLDLIKNQLDGSTDKQVDAIFMVGGFGKSIYLHRRVKETFVPRVKFVGIPPRAEMAVVRGAVYFGLKPRLVTQRVSRRTYGLNSQVPFDPLYDPSENYTLLGDTAYCKGRFSVYATKGQTINLDECVTKKYYVPYPYDNETDLYAYDGDGPPPRLISDPRVKLVARFPIKMPTFDDVNVGEQLLMTINMFFGRTEIKLEVLIRDRGCIFTSRLDLMAADTSIQNAPPDLPPPYSSPKLIAASSPIPPPLNIGDVATTSSFASTLPTAEIVGSMKPDDVAGNDTVVTNKPDESEPTSPTITQRSGRGSNDNDIFPVTTLNPYTPTTLLTNSYQPSELPSSKTAEPSSTSASESPPSLQSTPSLSSSTSPKTFYESSAPSAKAPLPLTPSSEPLPSGIHRHFHHRQH